MSPANPPQLVLVTGETVTLSDEVIAQLEAALRARRAGEAEPRDLFAEIATCLERNPGSSTTEIARAIRARDADVRRILNRDPRFQRVPPDPGRSIRLRVWSVAPVDTRVGPGAGTGTPDVRSARS
jgi:hypothetical protein